MSARARTCCGPGSCAGTGAPLASPGGASSSSPLPAAQTVDALGAATTTPVYGYELRLDQRTLDVVPRSEVGCLRVDDVDEAATTVRLEVSAFPCTEDVEATAVLRSDLGDRTVLVAGSQAPVQELRGCEGRENELIAYADCPPGAPPPA